jgi:eukaryotic-like serine/threonine-protein kinase
MLLMTPEYASPEQVNGDSITTLTDVYSLGVILYELLTGHRPHHLLKAAVREVARVLAEEEPTRPSLVVATTQERLTPQAVSEVREGDPHRLRKRLEGDLDCIVLTALHKEPVRRYSSVEAFGEDLGRHLENRPVNAREDSFWYRVSRFVRRHPTGAEPLHPEGDVQVYPRPRRSEPQSDGCYSQGREGGGEADRRSAALLRLRTAFQ